VLQLLEVLGGEHDRSVTLAHAARDVPQPPTLARVERRGRLVEQEHLGSPKEGDGKVEPLLVARRELGRQASIVWQLEQLDEARRSARGILDAFQTREELEVLPRSEPGVMRRALGHPPHSTRAVTPLDAALGWLEGAGQDREERRLAGAVGPDERYRLAASDVEAGRRKGDDAPVPARDPARTQEEGAQRPPPLAPSESDPNRTASTPRIMNVHRPYDHAGETAAEGGRVVSIRPPAWEWTFETEGALALVPEVATGLKAHDTSATVPRMARPEAHGLAYRAATREETRARVRRARRTTALLVAACVCLVVLLLTAFGTGGVASQVSTGPAPANRLLPAGPPHAQVIALQDTLRIQMPINQSRVTAIGYHASGSDVLALQPVGTQENAGVVRRLFHRLFGQNGSGLRYYQLGGGVGPQTGGLDVGAPVNTDVYAPVDGSVMAISDMIVNGKAYGVRIDIQPTGSPGVVVTLENLKPDPALTVGSAVSAGRTKIGRIIDLSSVEQAALARYTQDKGQHVHIEVRAASGLAAP
jgi:murein DD-endopeptidase MepM/ murein hydrolase activator NlpD